MLVFHYEQDTKRQLVEAMSLQININQLPCDPSLTPYLDTEVAQILGVNHCDIPFLHSLGILERTTRKWGQASDTTWTVSYWDMFNSTACMSLLAIGCSRDCASEIAFKIYDLIAELREDRDFNDPIDFVNLSELIGQVLDTSDIRFLPNYLSYPSAIIAKKVAIDLLQMHQRCLTVPPPVLARLM